MDSTVEDEEFTFIGGKGNTMIDYVLGDEKMRKRVVNLKIGEKIDSDHQLLIVVKIEKDKKRRKPRKDKERIKEMEKERGGREEL